MAHDVFISYATSDKAVADAVCSQLESIHRIRCWIAPRDVTPGASWAESIIDALDGSKIMVLIFSSNANASMQIEREVERAVHKGINIIPLRIENTVPTKTLEYFISAPHWLDALSVPLELHINKLAASVKALLSKHGIQVPAGPAAIVSGPTEAAAPVAVPVAPAAPRPAATPPRPAQSPRNSWVVPVSLGAAVVAIAALAALLWTQRSEREGSPERSPAAIAQPSIPAATPAATLPPPAAAVAPPVTAARPAAPPTNVPAAAPTTPMPATPEGELAAPAAAAVVRNANFFVDFRNTLDEGSIALDVDGQRKWSSPLGARFKADKRRSEDLKATLNLPKGPHKVTVTLLTPAGKVREMESTPVLIDPAMPRTLNIRLSRFKKNLELKTVVNAPAEAETALAAKPKAADPTKPTATTKPPATAKPSAAAKPATPKPTVTTKAEGPTTPPTKAATTK